MTPREIGRVPRAFEAHRRQRIATVLGCVVAHAAAQHDDRIGVHRRIGRERMPVGHGHGKPPRDDRHRQHHEAPHAEQRETRPEARPASCEQQARERDDDRPVGREHERPDDLGDPEHCVLWRRTISLGTDPCRASVPRERPSGPGSLRVDGTPPGAGRIPRVGSCPAGGSRCRRRMGPRVGAARTVPARTVATAILEPPERSGDCTMPTPSRLLPAGCMLVLTTLTSPVAHSDFRPMTNVFPSDLKWVNVPGVPKAIELARVFGNPSQPGPYVFRARMRAGTKLPPHIHPDERWVTVLHGTYRSAVGETFSIADATEYPEGSFYVTEAGAPHYSYAVTDVIVQEQGNGPTGMAYVHHEDDPRYAR
ncbi:MAG: cupin domain-containing protein [Betaproteobacteria bacterium]|nr:cupin domain-containing protein [Betaproteobacteria bacterium]